MWWHDAVVYELYVDTFAKNFKGLTQKLAYLSELGVNTILILPHYPSPMVDGGYDVSNYKAVRFELGDFDEFGEFMGEASKRKIRVIIDLVLNHTSCKHPWFMDARSSKLSAHRDWYVWGSDRKRFVNAENAFLHFKASNWIYNEKTRDYYYATFYPEQPDLNWDNVEVFTAFIEIMRFWIDKGVSGFRLDAVSHMIKRDHTKSINDPKVHEVVKKIRAWLNGYNPEVVLLAEATGRHEEVQEYFGNGDECHMVFNFGLTQALFLKYIMDDDSLFGVYKKNMLDIPTSCAWAVLVRNHDALSLKNLSPHDREQILSRIDYYKDYSFVDGVSVSMRLASIINDKEKMKALYSDLFSLDATQILYYGSEIGMKNESFSVHPKDTRAFVRGPFDWDEAYKQRKDPSSLFSHIKQMIVKK